MHPILQEEVMPTADERHQEALESLHPVFKFKVDEVLAQLRLKGWQPVLVYGRRTEEQQQQKIREGVGGKHSWHVASTEARISGPEGRTIETVRGCAADVVDRRWAWDGPCSNKNHQFWKDLGAAAKSAGLQWGGDWKKRDVAHVQMKFIEDRPLSAVVV
jgi:D-alanyl-D-alanine carboxypeptidase-like protein